MDLSMNRLVRPASFEVGSVSRAWLNWCAVLERIDSAVADMVLQ